MKLAANVLDGIYTSFKGFLMNVYYQSKRKKIESKNSLATCILVRIRMRRIEALRL